MEKFNGGPSEDRSAGVRIDTVRKNPDRGILYGFGTRLERLIVRSHMSLDNLREINNQMFGHLEGLESDPPLMANTSDLPMMSVLSVLMDQLDDKLIFMEKELERTKKLITNED